MEFAGRTAFITGGGSGIGEVFADHLAARGAHVVLADIDLAVAEAAAIRIRGEGHKALAVACDVADQASVEAAVAQTVAQCGGLDILINNAARHLMTYAGPPTGLSSELWSQMLNVNVVGVINCARAARPHLAKRPGVIINMSSIAGFSATSPYGVSKLAVRGLTVGLATEFSKDGVRVCGIAPGLVDSPAATAEVPDEIRKRLVEQVQLVHRHGTMTDLANAMLFFCSDQASFVTGETLIVGGGSSVRI